MIINWLCWWVGGGGGDSSAAARGALVERGSGRGEREIHSFPPAPSPALGFQDTFAFPRY